MVAPSLYWSRYSVYICIIFTPPELTVDIEVNLEPQKPRLIASVCWNKFGV